MLAGKIVIFFYFFDSQAFIAIHLRVTSAVSMWLINKDGCTERVIDLCVQDLSSRMLSAVSLDDCQKTT